MKNKMLLAFAMSLIFGGYSFGKTIEIKERNVSFPLNLEGSKLLHNKKGFSLLRGNKVYAIKNEFIDSKLRNLSNSDLDFVLGNKAKIVINGEEAILTRINDDQKKEIIDASKEISKCSSDTHNDIISQLPPMSYIKVIEYEDGDIKLQLQTKLVGGGVWGAIGGAWAGKFIASAVCHTGIFLVSAAVSVVATPAVGTIVFSSLETTLGSTIEATTTAVALAGGIAGGVATGPV